MIEKKFKLFADYFQFYIQDEKSESIDVDSWMEGSHKARIAVEEGAFAVGTARNMDVPVSVVISATKPSLKLSHWDHVVEFSINVSSGVIVIAGCMDYFPDAERLSMERGNYQVRVLHASLDKLSEDELDGDDNYRVEMWKGVPKPLQILKQHPLR